MSKHAGNTTKHLVLLDSQAPIPCQTSSFTREFSLSTNQSAPRGERFTVLPGKVYFQVLPAPPSLRYTTRHQHTQGQCTRQYPGPATTTHTAERPRRPRSVYTYSARHALATFRLSSSQRNAHSGSFIPGDCGPRSPRRARASEDRVPCDRRRSTQQLAKPQDEASERRPRARVHQRYAVFHAVVGKCVQTIFLFTRHGSFPKHGAPIARERVCTHEAIQTHRRPSRRID